jgi:hypothetical protein
MEVGPDRIIKTLMGDLYCDECYRDINDGTDRDPSLYVQGRLTDGRCGCCGQTIENGEAAGDMH